MIYLRYIVYRDTPKAQKRVAFWTDDVIHTTYAQGKGILPQNFLSGGYMRPFFGKWVPHEHYQLDGNDSRLDKSLVKEEFKKHPEFQTPELARAINRTFHREKRTLRTLMMMALANFSGSRIRK